MKPHIPRVTVPVPSTQSKPLAALNLPRCISCVEAWNPTSAGKGILLRKKSCKTRNARQIPGGIDQIISNRRRLRVPCVSSDLVSMSKAELLRSEEEILFSSVFDSNEAAETVKSRGRMIEKKIDVLEGLASKVSNRRSRRWLNDRLLIELVPRLHVEEIRGLFSPPPWGEELPLSAFCRTNFGDWDAFRNIDMDVEARLIERMQCSSAKQKNHVDEDRLNVLNAWRRIDRQTREALKRNFLPDLLEIYEERIRAFIEGAGDADVLVLNVQDPFQRLLLHGVCEFYNLTSATVTTWRDAKLWKTTTIKRRSGTGVPPKITLVSFLKMKKDGAL